MADEIYIDPATFDTAAAGIEKAQADLQGAFDNFTAVLVNLGDFLGNDDAGTQLKADYNPASENFRTGIQKLLGGKQPRLIVRKILHLLLATLRRPKIRLISATIQNRPQQMPPVKAVLRKILGQRV